MRRYLLWIIVIASIAVNHIFHFILTELPDGYALFRALPIVSQMRYGDYLTQKWFLVIIAFLIFFWRVKKHGNIKSVIRENILFIILIAIVTFGAHIFSFSRWFEFDDYRVIGHHFAVEGTPRQNQMGAGSSYYYGIGLVYLVVGWFGTHFELYNALGFLIYSLIGVTVFLIAKKLEVNRTLAFLIAAFFVTSPTYYRETLIMLELLGDGFKLLLFALSCLLLISKFYPGAVIFAAAALEFGISRTHFIGVPLILMCILFKIKKEKKLDWVLAIISFFVMSFLYIQVFGTHPPQIIDQQNWLNNWNQVIRISDTTFGVIVPHGVNRAVIPFFEWLFDRSPSISPALGGAIVLVCVLLSGMLFLKRKIFPAKLIFIGIATTVSAIIFPTLMGIRLTYNVESLTAQYEDIFPAAPTSYGVFSTFGIIFVLIGISKVVRQNPFSRVLVFVILLNAATLVKSDLAWAQIYSRPQRAVNIQLNSLLPYDGKPKVIYTPPPTQVLSRYVSYFYQLFRIKESLNFTNDSGEFIKLLEEYRPDKERVFILLLDTQTHEIIDLSSKIREYYPEKKLTPDLVDSLAK